MLMCCHDDVLFQGAAVAGGPSQLHGHHQATGGLGGGARVGAPVVWKLGKGSFKALLIDYVEL